MDILAIAIGLGLFVFFDSDKEWGWLKFKVEKYRIVEDGHGFQAYRKDGLLEGWYCASEYFDTKEDLKKWIDFRIKQIKQINEDRRIRSNKRYRG